MKPVTILNEPSIHDREQALANILEKLSILVKSGVAHGHFEMMLLADDAKAGWTEVIIKAGKKYRFLVPKE
jgi:hypothetical protein